MHAPSLYLQYVCSMQSARGYAVIYSDCYSVHRVWCRWAAEQLVIRAGREMRSRERMRSYRQLDGRAAVSLTPLFCSTEVLRPSQSSPLFTDHIYILYYLPPR